MGFVNERAFAIDFLARLRADTAMQAEVLYVIKAALERFDTGPWENRFVIGGVVEQVIGSAARDLGFNVDNVGAKLQSYDLELGTGEGLSVKFQSGLHSRATTIRLTNSQGNVGVWGRGTFFVHTGVGIGYSDPELTPGITRAAAEARSLDVCLHPLLGFWGFAPRAQLGRPPAWLAGLPTFTPDPRYFLALDVPDRETIRATRLVSDPIAKDLMNSGRTPRLNRAHKDAR